MRRRTVLSAAGSLVGLLGACSRRAPGAAAEFDPNRVQGGWVGASHQRGHRLRHDQASALPEATRQRRADVLILGGGIAGLSSARALMRRGIADVQLLELEDSAGGASRGHRLGGLACPLGAHYLPLPAADAAELNELLHDLGLLRHASGRSLPDERHLCHSPQERLFYQGQWHEGLLPPADPGSSTHTQYQRFARAVQHQQRELGFQLPTRRGPWTAVHQGLDAITFAHWLDGQGLDDERLRWYLDYCCRDDYGAASDQVSAWAGLHYFGSRHGFHAPGDEDVPREAVFTWPQGNAWIAERLAQDLGAERLHAGRVVLRVQTHARGVQVRALDAASGAVEHWQARAAVLALPLNVAVRVLEAPPQALVEAAARARYAPWLVANLLLEQPLVERVDGASLAWDNVAYRGASLGYVNARHQDLSPAPTGTLLTAYWALPEAGRAQLLQANWSIWAQRVLADLSALHPDLPDKLRQIDLMRWGHAMSIPAPGVRGSAALQALAEARGRIVHAHADLAGYSVFEEAYCAGVDAARRLRL